MASKEKQVIESEFKLINISKAAIIDHFPCNTSEVQLFNLGFAHGQRSNTNMRSVSNLPPFANTQNHLLFPISRPSPLRGYYVNNNLKGMGALRSAAIIHKSFFN